MVVDTSAILALLLGEPSAAWVAERLNENAGALRMSTVNLTEALIRLRDLQPALAPSLERKLFSGAMRFVPPSVDQARLAAEARLRFPLNLGDCFAYALAMTDGVSLLTLDADFGKTDATVVKPPPPI